MRGTPNGHHGKMCRDRLVAGCVGSGFVMWHCMSGAVAWSDSLPKELWLRENHKLRMTITDRKSESRLPPERAMAATKSLKKEAQQHNCRSQEWVLTGSRESCGCVGSIEKVSSGAQLPITRASLDSLPRESRLQQNHSKTKLRSTTADHKSESRQPPERVMAATKALKK